jgi:hypothetical protein
MDSLRQISCTNPSCGRLFYLCPWCDRGAWYCGPSCKEDRRRAARRVVAQRHWRSRAGRVVTSRRVHRLRARRAKNVTDRGTREVGPSPMVPSPAEVSLPLEVPSAGEEKDHGLDLDGDRPGPDVDAGAGDARRERDDLEGEAAPRPGAPEGVVDVPGGDRALAGDGRARCDRCGRRADFVRLEPLSKSTLRGRPRPAVQRRLGARHRAQAPPARDRGDGSVP